MVTKTLSLARMSCIRDAKEREMRGKNRIADRVTNICERVVYMVTGRIEEMNVSKY